MPGPDVLLDATVDDVRRHCVDALGARPAPDDDDGDDTDGGLRCEIPFTSGDAVPILVHLQEEGTGCRVDLGAEPIPRVPYFPWFVGPVLRSANRRALAHAAAVLRAAVAGTAPPAIPRRPGLAPPAVFSHRQAVLLATVAAVTAVTTYGGSLLSQNVSYVGDSFDASNQALGVALALSRAGVVIALVATALADRQGRRRLLLISFAGVCAANAVAALAPNLTVFTIGQVLMRGFVNTAITVATVTAIEGAPEGARAYSLSLLGLAGGAGYAIGVLLLPLADLGPEAWRISFAISALSVVLLYSFSTHLAETERYRDLEARGAKRGRVGEVFDASYGGRFGLLVLAGFLFAIFAAPSSQFANEYLKDERGFSAFDITAFRAITQGVPGVVGLIIGGRLAESRGRRPVAAWFVFGGAAAQIVFLLTGGVSLWLASVASIVLGGIAAPAFGAFSGELFPTEIRGTANGMLLVAGVMGSAVGLVAAGTLSNGWGLGPSVALMGIPSLVAAALLVPRLPEPAARPLDEVSPSEV